MSSSLSRANQYSRSQQNFQNENPRATKVLSHTQKRVNAVRKDSSNYYLTTLVVFNLLGAFSDEKKSRTGLEENNVIPIGAGSSEKTDQTFSESTTEKVKSFTPSCSTSFKDPDLISTSKKGTSRKKTKNSSHYHLKKKQLSRKKRPSQQQEACHFSRPNGPK